MPDAAATPNQHTAPRAGTDTASDELVRDHMGLITSLARRYANRGEPLDDLIQVATIGLLQAAQRFDPGRGIAFSSFATPTILGELRRHFRDNLWMVHVPRGVKESSATVTRTIDLLTTTLGRSPRVHEIAEHTGLTEDEVLDAMAAANAYRPDGFELTDADGDRSDTHIAADEPAFEWVEGRAGLGEAIGRLDARAQTALRLRFDREMSQSQIAAQLGVSQMHVSRILREALDRLRATMGA